MKQVTTAPTGDIADESYQGPSRAVAAAGEGVIAHYGVAFAMLIAGAASTFIFHKPAEKMVTSIRGWSHRAGSLPKEGILDTAKHYTGRFAGAVFGHGSESTLQAREAIKTIADTEKRELMLDHLTTHEQGFGHWFLMHTAGLIPPARRSLRTLTDRQTTAFTVGGIAGFAGFMLSPIYYGFSGVRHANAGREQFQRAKDEVLATREEREALRSELVSARLELNELKTREATASAVRVANDNPPELPGDSAPMPPDVLPGEPSTRHAEKIREQREAAAASETTLSH
jgi:hypothetical protein